MTREPKTVNAAFHDRLRQEGLSDQDILDTVQITGFFNYYNRMVDALGVPLEADM